MKSSSELEADNGHAFGPHQKIGFNRIAELIVHPPDTVIGDVFKEINEILSTLADPRIEWS